ncbi:YbhB/YbcL family Raf kinase inhibitor-like protein [Cytophagaceae bacterium YF14B1]|uniref:YbhB/YbcL family Raf kinase inhibitor-like protein n=1 Tax=Xanthocytophaga flava TaxID=3048013 RepID=A0AAE3U8F2_9BACT|nr:YbhB/YbcL family Raf kinase inhibitor-like protein [Xanthocytophaga flavus]MDJ1481128.1 YbhB/YbcL family Raf kinase inhibitor-like protein [Xanthocytophaga flavus]
METQATVTQTFTLRSKEVGGQFTQKQFGNGPGCSGENISPELHWENAPSETKAFAVTMHDVDAPTGSGLWHWVVYNIPPSITSLASDAGSLSENNLPEGAVGGLSDIGVKGYFGPCPPAGELHRYIITVHALKEPIAANENASAALTGFMLTMNTLVKASLLVYGQG